MKGYNAMHEIIELTKALIRFKTMHKNPEEILRCAGFIENYFKKHHIVCKRVEHDGTPSIFVLPAGKTVPVLLMSHIDVVDAPDELFEPVEKEGKLHGRGSIDDKYAAALSMVLVKEHVARLRKKGMGQEELPFGVLITGDEETGGVNGAKKALGLVDTDFCIALDGGSIQTIVIKEKGIWRLKLVARGKAAHGARPWLGENAIENLMADYALIKPFFDPSADAGAEHWHRTLNFSIIQAGTSLNQVPDYAQALFDIRYTEADNLDKLLEQMRGVIKGELIEESREPLFLGGDSPYLDLLLKIADKTGTGAAHGASDARFLSDYGIKGIVWGADGDMSQHALDEHINIDSIRELYTVLDEFMKKIP
jgi:succinyl-diaminopimelate desuccinylase